MAMTRKEHRKFSRILFDVPVVITSTDKGAGKSPDKKWNSTVIDVSLKGALILRPDDWNGKINDAYQLELKLDGKNVEIKMDVTVAHVEDGRIGLICNHIDIDSITHLRRVVELNLADEELLYRELAALG